MYVYVNNHHHLEHYHHHHRHNQLINACINYKNRLSNGCCAQAIVSKIASISKLSILLYPYLPYAILYSIYYAMSMICERQVVMISLSMSSDYIDDDYYTDDKRMDIVYVNKRGL